MDVTSRPLALSLLWFEFYHRVPVSKILNYVTKYFANLRSATDHYVFNRFGTCALKRKFRFLKSVDWKQ